MYKPKYLYDIFDVVENEYMFRDAKLHEVPEIIDISPKEIITYCKTGAVFNGRYTITKKQVIETPEPEEHTNSIPKYLWDDFTKTVEALKAVGGSRLQNIKITRSNYV